MNRWSVLLFLGCLNFLGFSQSELLQSGPMLGYSDFREVLIWVQTTEEAEVSIAYTDELGITRVTPPYRTSPKEDFIAKILPGPLKYGSRYRYTLLINNEEIITSNKQEFQSQPLWQNRMDPPNFSFAIGSCNYVNEPIDDRLGSPYGGSYEIFNQIRAKNPDFMLWLGDNVYLRTPDFLTERGLRHRYRHTRALRELQPLLAGVHHYAIWDDHDYGTNDSNMSYANKQLTEQIFNDYWGNLNTNVVGNGGITNQFLWVDVEFFMLDNRYHREANELQKKTKSYFGEAQLKWLINALSASKATFKVVVSGGQVISDAQVFENYANYPVERQWLIEQLHEQQIEGVLFMTGDRHHTEISKLERPEAYPLIDITCSPLTAGTYSPRDEGNRLQVKDKVYFNRNFGIVKIRGTRNDRELLLDIYNSDGQLVWDYRIKASDLKYK